MTRIELLASQLDKEASENELKAVQQIFTQGLEFWMLCLECKRLIAEENNDKDKRAGDSQVAA